MRKKQIRFGDLVRQSGRPEVATLWTEPSRDRSLLKAIKENRVLTVTQDPASKRKEFGRIGFQKGPHSFLFVFPRPLPKASPTRVIGINEALINH